MSTAPSWSALYDFPGNVSAAWAAILDAQKSALIGSDTLADPSAFFFGPRDNAAETKDCITYSASAFTQASDQQVRSTQNGNWFFAHYAGTLTTMVKTPRGATGDAAVNSAAAAHGPRVGLLLALLAPAAQKFTSTGGAPNLPYYALARITAQAIPQADPEDVTDLDVTSIVAHLDLWIQPDAFPAALP
jgi:hypothetical protein